MISKNEQPYEIPNNWRWSIVGNIATLHRGVSYKKNDAHSTKQFDDFLIIRGGNIKEGYFDLEADNVYVNKNLVSEAQIIKKNDIVIVTSTGSEKVIGRAGISNKNYSDVSFGAFLILVRPLSNIKPLYLDYFFQSDVYRSRIKNLAAGININNVRGEHILNTPIPVPPPNEQQRIVDIIESLFEKLDKARALAQNIIDNYELRRAAILHKAFTGKLTHSNIDNWQEVNLSTVCEINPSKISTKNLPDKLEVTFLPMTSISAELGKIIELQRKPLIKVKKGFTNFSEGDVIFAKITPCMENGKSAIIGKLINDIGYGTTEFYVLRCSEKLYNRFLYHLIRSQKFRDEAKSVMTGAVGQQRVPKNFLKEYLLNLPTIEEQKEIVRILDSLLVKEQRNKELAEQILQKIDLMKKAILSRAFRGELGTN